VLGNKVEVNVEKLRKGGVNDLCLLKYLNQEGTAHLSVRAVVEGFSVPATWTDASVCVTHSQRAL
jgi:hypothetical protein